MKADKYGEEKVPMRAQELYQLARDLDYAANYSTKMFEERLKELDRERAAIDERERIFRADVESAPQKRKRAIELRRQADLINNPKVRKLMATMRAMARDKAAIEEEEEG